MPKDRLESLKKGISERIREVLTEKGWSQQQLADALGKDKGDISRILSGSVNLTLETVALIEEALGANIIQATKKK